jgi:hypothetical protein
MLPGPRWSNGRCCFDLKRMLRCGLLFPRCISLTCPDARKPRRTDPALKTGFRPGRSGACEARLYLFKGVVNGEGEPPATRVAACDLHEALAYMQKWHPGFDIQCAELVAMIEMVSGSPLN